MMGNTYIDCIAYIKAPTGLVLTPFIGNIARMSTSSVGATSLAVPATTVAQVQYDSLYIFDGPFSEVVQVGSSVASGATSIPLQAGTTYAHVAGTPYCTDGSDGSLGEQIFTASKWIEDDICYQALYSTTYAGEILTAPTMRAALDNQGNLHFRPRHFPISALSAVTVKTNAQNITSYDATQAIIDADQQTVDLALQAVLSSQNQTQGSPWACSQLTRSTNAWITITYTAGYAASILPRPITRACTLLVSDLFAPLENTLGAAAIQQNKRRVEFALRGDISGESKLYKNAVAMLVPYTTQSF